MSDGRILVIDDSEVVLAKVKAVLTEAGYDVQTTTQTVGAARFLRSCDLVLVDFHMPGIDGSSVLLSLQGAASTSGSSCAFYLFTSDSDLAIRYASFGFDGAIRNKGDHASLVTQVRAAMRMKKMREIARKKKAEGGTPMAINNAKPAAAGSVPPPPPPPPSSRPAAAATATRRTGFPPPRLPTDIDDEDDDELAADFPRTPSSS
jgi:two-component system, OmpR family, response regulator